MRTRSSSDSKLNGRVKVGAGLEEGLGELDEATKEKVSDSSRKQGGETDLSFLQSMHRRVPR
jgi:hypothetical protein